MKLYSSKSSENVRNGYVEYKEMCVKGFKDEKPWAEAEEFCNHQPTPSNLVAIHDKAMNEYVFSQLQHRKFPSNCEISFSETFGTHFK